VVAWQRVHGRHDLPWQGSRDAYRIWVSEIMLQQTQVGAVVPYFTAFMARFPDVVALATAPEDAVLAHWSGLGYYARARHLHRAARRIVEQHAGTFPRGADALAALPGIGRSTAAAIRAFAFGERAAILDGNVKRVLARHAGIDGWPGTPAVERALWAAAEARLPDAPGASGADSAAIEPYTQGLMDLGSLVCTRTRPACSRCPVADDCVARRDGRTAQLPAPRPRKVLPRRETWMLVLVADAAVWLEKRPGAGLWGGLWSLPEVPTPEPHEAWATRLGVAIVSTRALPTIDHGFTHFRLAIRPLQVDARRTGSPAAHDATTGRWVPWHEVPAQPLPAPVRALLAGLDPSAGFSLA
jgi:A/G-specific adenine glycosylase